MIVKTGGAWGGGGYPWSCFKDDEGGMEEFFGGSGGEVVCFCSGNHAACRHYLPLSSSLAATLPPPTRAPFVLV